jgi:hypothetical protein
MTEETEVLETGVELNVTTSEPIEVPELSISFDEYTQEISEDLVVTILGDGRVVDRSGPFDTRENAEAFAASFVDALSQGDIKPNPASIEG